ncbi:hypothetical protein O3P69_020572 [Scylla paramamosain]|uniref:Uncharacterized protein n=1 Tax=Scylla paramamosain TaxID=85552 RepID=A0AAW0TLR5_SCYPA
MKRSKEEGEEKEEKEEHEFSGILAQPGRALPACFSHKDVVLEKLLSLLLGYWGVGGVCQVRLEMIWPRKLTVQATSLPQRLWDLSV